MSSSAEVSVFLTGDEEIRELNSRFRGKDKATDVLSFPMTEAGVAPDEEGLAKGPGKAPLLLPILLGDIVISVETARSQAASYGVSTLEEVSRLLIHGALHLIGYEHVNGGRQAAKMKLKEDESLKRLKKSAGALK